MPSRETTYRVTISSSDARRQARNVRSVFEAELRTITMGRLDTSALTRGVGEAQRLRFELEKAAQASGQIQPHVGGSMPSGGGVDMPSGLSSGLLGGVAIAGTIAGIREIGGALDDLSRRGAVYGQIADVLGSYAKAANTTADAIVIAATKASMGTISQYELMLNANRALQFEVAKTPEQFAKLVELSSALGRAQGISDTQSLEFLTTGLARESRLILDNLGLIINLDQATAKYAATLGKTADQLTASERKAALLDEAYRQGATALEANRAASESAATVFERLDANVQNAKDTFGQLFAELSKDYVSAFSTQVAELTNYFVVLSKGADSSIGDLKTRLDILRSGATEGAKIYGDLGRDNSVQSGLVVASDEAIKSLDQVAKAISDGVPGADKYEQQVKQIVNALIDGATTAPEAVSALRKVNADLAALTSNPATQQAMQANQAKAQADAAAAEQARIVAEQSETINKALTSRATKSAAVVGAEAAIEQLRQQKALAEQAIQALVASGVTGSDALAINVAAIIDQLTAPFDALEERASQGFNLDVSAFDSIGTALSSLNAGFTDFLPGVASAREELVSLSTELAMTGQLSAEQAAQLEYLSAVAYSVADGGSQLNAVVNELGTEFLSSNAYAAELVNQLFLAEAAFRSNQIGAGEYAGITAILSGQLLTLADSAGIATGAIYALNSAQAGMASPAGLAVGGSIANRVQSQQATQGREQNRREMERYNRDVERAQTRSATKAGKLLEDGAKKANQELKSALDKVPGLFSTSQVTEQDMKDAELGVYQEKADEYLRRLRDEIQNGHDWEDVSLEEARAGLERAGLEVGGTAEATLAMLEKSINDSSLFSAAENIPIFINEEAVKYAQELQNKSEQGRKNIYAYFGVQVDEAVSSATGGGGGGGGAPKIEPPKLVDIDPLTEGLQTGLDEYVDASGKMVKEQIATAEKLFFDPAGLFGTGAKTGGTMGPATKPTITVEADDTLKALTPALTGQAQPVVSFQYPGGTTPGAAAGAQEITLTPVLPEDAGSTIAMDLGNQLAQQATVLASHGSNIGKAMLVGVSSVLGVGAKGEVNVDIAGLIAGNLAAQYKTFQAQGAGVGSALSSGITTAMSGGNATIDVATPLVAAITANIATYSASFSVPGTVAAQLVNAGITTAFDTNNAELEIAAPLATALTANVASHAASFAVPGTVAAQLVNAGIVTAFEGDGSTAIDVATPLVTALTTNIASNSAAFATPGMVVAQLIMAAILTNMQGGAAAQGGAGGGAATGGGGGPIASALVSNLAMQFSMAAPQFSLLGQIPAGMVGAGFKAYPYEGLVDSFVTKLTTEITAQGAALAIRGTLMAGYVQSGFAAAFNAEGFKAQLIAIGELMYTYLEIGILGKVDGGALTTAIADKVVTDIAAEMEK